MFADHEQLEELNQIVHPEVERLRVRLVDQARKRGDRIVICDIPLLFERHMTDRFDLIVLVDAHRAVRLERLVKERGLGDDRSDGHDRLADAGGAEARARRFRDRQRRLADALERRVDEVWAALLRDATPAAERRYPSLTLFFGSDRLRAERHPSPTTEHVVSDIPKDLLYTEDHEYVKPTDDPNVVAIGITDYAQGELGDIVFIELPKVGASFAKHDVFGTVEAVKAVSELYSPIAGEVVAVNDRLDKEPALVNTAPYGDGWMVKVRLTNTAEKEGLLSADAYGAHLGE